MLTHAFFLSNRRESLVRAFRKKTPLSVRRPGGGGLRGVRKVSIETELFFYDGFPKSSGGASEWDAALHESTQVIF